MFDLISTTIITFLNELDNRIDINKSGKFCYYKCPSFETEDIQYFLKTLDDNKIYIIIPFISKNNWVNEPYIILSRQILITNKSNSLLLSNFINDKIEDTIDLYRMESLDKHYTILKQNTLILRLQILRTFYISNLLI